MRNWTVVTVVGLLALGMTACGGIDQDKLEDEVSADFQERIDASGTEGSVESVSCPDDVESETGTEFECELVMNDGSEAVANGEVTDGDEGDVEYTFTSP